MTTVLLRDGVADVRARRVWRSDLVARLSEAETAVLSLLARSVGQNVDRQRILVEALGHHPGSLTRAVDLCVHRLRTKLERDPAAPAHLLTVQGSGYRLVPADEVEEARTNLPPPRTALLGRDRELAIAREALEAGPVVLIGPAGVGKSRLAQELAAAAARTWAPAGAWWVDLSEAADAEAVGRAVAAAVGLEAAPGELLADRLRERGPSLVVLDTCERCVAPAAALAQALGPLTRVLATSRVPLPGIRPIGVDPLADDVAVELLRARAAQAGVDVPLDEDAVRRLVATVDRLPLAIELAAARLPAMPLQRVERELARPLRLLRARSGEGRQASVEASVRWSWDALDEPDRDALVVLATFRGPVPDEAAAALVPAGAVERLLAAHLLRRVPRGVTPWHAVREVVEAEADGVRWAEAISAHDRWLTEAAAVWVEDLRGPRFAATLDALEAADRDLAAAEGRAPHGALALARAELDFERGRFADLVARVDASPLADDPRRIALLTLAAGAVGRLGDWPAAQARAEAALAEARTDRERVEPACVVSNAFVRRNRFAEGAEVADRAAAWAGDDPYLRARAGAARGLVAFFDWRGDESLVAMRRAVEQYEAAGTARFLPIARHNVAAALMRSGRTDEAEAALLVAAASRQNPRAAGITHLNLAMLRLARDVPSALVHAERALELFRDCGAADGERAALGLCGVLKVLLGDAADGLADLDEEHARIASSRGPNATNSRLTRVAALSMVGRVAEARAVFDAIGPDLAGDMGLTEADADALRAAWLEDRKLPAEVLARMEEVGGDRRWFQARLLRWAGRA